MDAYLFFWYTPPHLGSYLIDALLILVCLGTKVLLVGISRINGALYLRQVERLCGVLVQHIGRKTSVDTKIIQRHGQYVCVVVSLTLTHWVLLDPPLDEDVYNLILVSDGDGRSIYVAGHLLVLRLLNLVPYGRVLVDVYQWVVRLIAHTRDVL